MRTPRDPIYAGHRYPAEIIHEDGVPATPAELMRHLQQWCEIQFAEQPADSTLKSELRVIEAQRRHLGPTELTAGDEPAVTADHAIVAIDQNRDIEAKRLDAVAPS